MVDRRFSLAALLKLRTTVEERAAGELAGARRVRLAAAAEVDRTRDELAATGLGHVSEVHVLSSGTDPRMWQATVAGRAALGSLLAERRMALVAARDEEERASAVWTRARRDTRAIERLEERHTEAVRAAELHAEQTALDEVAGQRAARAAVARGGLA
ncbi:flagellar FliJ family protein [Cellulomonas endophytica]|uniref:flagellar FliJ family protein n=1 Tax=Cellulomonas endophytica TaxID=2494735 RepID=UPI001013A343|nr:flagellar FliJ family protein [Cellulomonas endophytica]